MQGGFNNIDSDQYKISSIVFDVFIDSFLKFTNSQILSFTTSLWSIVWPISRMP